MSEESSPNRNANGENFEATEDDAFIRAMAEG